MTNNSLRNRYRRDFTTDKISTHPITSVSTPDLTPQAYNSLSGAGMTVVAGSRFGFFKSALLRDVLICMALVVIGVLAFSNTRSNTDKKSPQAQPQTQAPAVAQKQPVTDNKTSTLGTSSSAAPSTTQAPSPLGSLPTTFHVNNDKQTSGGVTTYSISDNANNNYNVVEEPITATNNQDSFAKSLTNTETLTVPLGKAVIGDTSSEVLAGIQTSDNHLVIVGAPAINLRTQLEVLIKSM